MGYYPDFIFPKLAEARKRMMPRMVTAYYLRVFRGPPIGALYRSYPGPWQVTPPSIPRPNRHLASNRCMVLPRIINSDGPRLGLINLLSLKTLAFSICISISLSSHHSCTLVHLLQHTLGYLTERSTGSEGRGDGGRSWFLPSAVGRRRRCSSDSTPTRAELCAEYPAEEPVDILSSASLRTCTDIRMEYICELIIASLKLFVP